MSLIFTNLQKNSFSETLYQFVHYGGASPVIYAFVMIYIVFDDINILCEYIFL